MPHVMAAPPVVPTTRRGWCSQARAALTGRFLMCENVYELELWPGEVQEVDTQYRDVLPLRDVR